MEQGQSSKSGAREHWTATCKRMTLEHITPYTNIDSKGIRIECKTRNHKIPRRKQGWDTCHKA